MTRGEILTGIQVLADDVATSLRHEGFKCQTVQVTIKDPDFIVINRQKGIPATWLAVDLVMACMELIGASWPVGKPIRLLAVTAMKLLPRDAVVEQVTMFEMPEEVRAREKKERLAKAVDEIRRKHGRRSVDTAGVAFSDIGVVDRGNETGEE